MNNSDRVCRTPNDVMVNVDDIMGWVQLVKVQKVEDGCLYMGGYSIRYDRHNRAVSRTHVKWHCVLSYS